MFDTTGPRWPIMHLAPDAGSEGTAGAPTPSTPTTPPAGEQPGEGAAPGQAGTLQWDTWLGEQPEPIQTLIDSHTKGLRSALQSERTQRAELAKQLREATKTAAQGSELQKSLEALSGKLEMAELRARFFEEASKPEVNCTNPRMALLAAQELDAIDNKGRINWDAIKQAFPEIFRPVRPPQGNAGAGTTAPPPANMGGAMNAAIRRAAGR